MEQLAPMKYCREFALASGVGDGKTERYIQEVIGNLTDYLGYAIWQLVISEDIPNDSSTWDQKVEMMCKINQLYALIYGDDLKFYHSRVSFNHWIISTYTMAQGKTEETLSALEAMCRHAVDYEESYQTDHGKHYSSPLVDHLVYSKLGSELFPELNEHSHSYYLLDRLQDERYDPVRGHERFGAVINELWKYAR